MAKTEIEKVRLLNQNAEMENEKLKSKYRLSKPAKDAEFDENRDEAEDTFKSASRVRKEGFKQIEQEDCSKHVFEFNRKRSGHLIASHISSSANRCKRLCQSDSSCQAWNYFSDKQECSLLRNVDSSIQSSCCISGEKCENVS